LAEVMPEGVAFLITAVVVGIAALALALVGRKQLGATELVPRESISIPTPNKSSHGPRRTACAAPPTNCGTPAKT
jgi:hypothetical protein